MSGMTCDDVRAAALDPGLQPRDWMRRPEVDAHLRRCEQCRDWLEAFGAGEHLWAAEPADSFADAVLARTAGVEALLAELPSLAEMDPGPGFAQRVLLATSQSPAAAGWRVRWAGAWRAVVRRPRFAWEAAYVATVCWVLIFGNPVGAWEWSASNIGAVARERLGGPVKELRTDLESWRARWAPEPAAAPGAVRQQADAVPPALRAWQAAVERIQRGAAYVADALEHAWTSIGEWVAWLVQQIWPPPAEPQPSPVRSSQYFDSQLRPQFPFGARGRLRSLST
jgi:hypothetical protein